MGVGVGFPLWGGGYALFSEFVKDFFSSKWHVLVHSDS